LAQNSTEKHTILTGDNQKIVWAKLSTLSFSTWKTINHKQSTRWQHIPGLKASVLCSWQNKKMVVKNAATHTWDWCHHLVGDRA
jgi:hypothetical protein